ncbi:MAG: transglycosylase SLT domain-containing protein [Gammaproteobacteria bacterium]|nr:transglycosylase SLT domain-containing protein [Gammaproteobacteria bacterium]
MRKICKNVIPAKTGIQSVFLCIILALFVSGCAKAPPHSQDNICSIFRQYPEWYWDSQDVQKKWHIPISVLIAIMHQESHFHAGAKPPREHILWVIPWFRPTSAYGYSQATDESWKSYRRSTGDHGADRDDFADAANFIGWYAHQAQRKVGISPRDPYKLYLAYHEGLGGYARKTYLRKKWLIAISHKVSRRAWIYHRQLMGCMRSLPKKPWWRFW